MTDVPQAENEESARAANDGYVAGTYFARWNPSQDVRTLVPVILGGPVAKSVRDFFDGFIAGAEAEHLRQSNPRGDAVPFIVEWQESVEIGWGDTEWVVGPQPGPWRQKRP
jgi:hypothetical protein